MKNISDKVSIVIPVYNGEKYIEETLNSIMAQTHSQWEAILVDDSSTDDSYAILQQFAAMDSRFKVYQKPNQRFACYGIRYGVEHSTGDWFCYMSQDDRLSPDFLEKTLAAAAMTGADISLGKMVVYNADGETEFRMPVAEGDVICGLQAFELSLDWRIHGFYIIKMNLMRSVGISTGLLNDDEYDTRRHFLFAAKVTFCGGVFYYHGGNPDAITKKWTPAQLDYVKVGHKLRHFAREQAIENTGNIDRLLRGVSGDACIRAAMMVFGAYRQGTASRQEIRQVMDTISESRTDWQGSSTALKIGMTVRPVFGHRIALASIILAVKLQAKIRKIR